MFKKFLLLTIAIFALLSAVFAAPVAAQEDEITYHELYQLFFAAQENGDPAMACLFTQQMIEKRPMFDFVVYYWAAQNCYLSDTLSLEEATDLLRTGTSFHFNHDVREAADQGVLWLLSGVQNRDQVNVGHMAQEWLASERSKTLSEADIEALYMIGFYGLNTRLIRPDARGGNGVAPTYTPDVYLEELDEFAQTWAETTRSSQAYLNWSGIWWNDLPGAKQHQLEILREGLEYNPEDTNLLTAVMNAAARAAGETEEDDDAETLMEEASEYAAQLEELAPCGLGQEGFWQDYGSVEDYATALESAEQKVESCDVTLRYEFSFVRYAMLQRGGNYANWDFENELDFLLDLFEQHPDSSYLADQIAGTYWQLNEDLAEHEWYALADELYLAEYEAAHSD